mmetsp:Transcript_104629/g.223625  ORF Transcript_104629/g.223625 Transcript_104629/m.223625 type:complete len:800 (+) Transcript_104629:151-2550(+)
MAAASEAKTAAGAGISAGRALASRAGTPISAGSPSRAGTPCFVGTSCRPPSRAGAGTPSTGLPSRAETPLVSRAVTPGETLVSRAVAPELRLKTASGSRVLPPPDGCATDRSPSHGSSKNKRTWQDGSVYEGEFSHGFMHGRGERRWPCGRRYVGEWRRDAMSGEGELTWPDGRCYNGQFRLGAFQGKGTRVWSNGDRYVGSFMMGFQEGVGTFRNAGEGWVFAGQWLHGRMYGQGRLEWSDGTSYSGEWYDGIREGHGKISWTDGSCYEGPFKNNHIDGCGLKEFADGAWYKGHFADGEFQGHGLFHWPDGTEFEGLWQQSQIVGPGCHRFPDGTAVTGNFEDGGASGEGSKAYANGCVYSGMLLRNSIDRKGTWKWPDGRCYVGDFEDDAMHGQGTLIWMDETGLCTYKGAFQQNHFDGRGFLQWSSGASFEGEFSNGLYHGEGTFRWPGQKSVYIGDWELGEMCGHGTLTFDSSDSGTGSDSASSSYVYVGLFKHGDMEGKGTVTFSLPSGDSTDKYVGEFRSSKFNGLGTFSWGSGNSLDGLFEEGYVNRIGRKIYADGRIYTGELRYDLEHGKGVMSDGVRNLVAMWHVGVPVKELLQSCAPKLDPALLGLCEDAEPDAVAKPDAEDGRTLKTPGQSPAERGRTVMTSRRSLLPIIDEHGKGVDGMALVVFLNGDRYVGHLHNGRKHGMGTYVYADMVTYRGDWKEDALDGVHHPVTEESLPIEVRRLLSPKEDEQILEVETEERKRISSLAAKKFKIGLRPQQSGAQSRKMASLWNAPSVDRKISEVEVQLVE